MYLNLSRRAILVALAGAAFAGSSHATNLVEIDGTNIKFYYDADFWGSAPTVTGNSISFDLSDDFALTAKGRIAGAHKEVSYRDRGTGVLFAVAKDGAAIKTSYTQSFSGHANVDTSSADGEALASTGTYGGTDFTGGKMVGQTLLGYATASAYYEYGAPAAAGDFFRSRQLDSSGFKPKQYYRALQLDPLLSVDLRQFGIGTAQIALTDISYSFVMAVPEPETYAMMIAGLGLVGFAARRRGRHTSI